MDAVRALWSRCMSFLLCWLLLWQGMGSRPWAQQLRRMGSAVRPGLWSTGSAAAARGLSSAARPLEHGLSSCGARARLLHGLWGLPRSGIRPPFLHWQVDSSPLSLRGGPWFFHLKARFCFCFFSHRSLTPLYSFSFLGELKSDFFTFFS